MTDGQKAQAEQAVTALVTSQANTLVEAQKAIIVAQPAQNDKYTKRARPSIIYVGRRPRRSCIIKGIKMIS
ncbi:MAG: hypothetical protein HQK57_01705 [Deltaproteobacteria bacterium]|nr:hypothetical protein [Deltaproteobacteria bacterium]